MAAELRNKMRYDSNSKPPVELKSGSRKKEEKRMTQHFGHYTTKNTTVFKFQTDINPDDICIISCETNISLTLLQDPVAVSIM